jgi:hypothetical protein
MNRAARARTVKASVVRYQKLAPKKTARVKMNIQIVGTPNPARNA